MSALLLTVRARAEKMAGDDHNRDCCKDYAGLMRFLLDHNADDDNLEMVIYLYEKHMDRD